MRAPCRVDGCEQESRGRGLCGTHWRRWRTHGDPLIVLQPGVDYQVKATCSVDDCERKVHAHSFCQMHLLRWQKHGDPLIVGERLGRPLKGEHPTWAAVHNRLSRTRGRAAEHECVDCGGPAREWSYDNDDPDELRGPVGRFVLAYSLDLDHYDPRCTPCHRTFDQAHARV